MNTRGAVFYHGFVMEMTMPGLLARLNEFVAFICTARIAPGRGAAIALTVALIVVAAGQLRLGGPRESRPSV